MRLPQLSEWILLACLVTISKHARSQTSIETGTVHGNIHLADSGAPATGAIVSLVPTEESHQAAPNPENGEFIVRDQPHRADFHATVDASGRFQIDHVKPGDYYILTYEHGYLSQDAYMPSGALSQEDGSKAPIPPFVKEVHVTPNGTNLVNLKLERGGTVAGTVRFVDGSPAHTGKQAASGVAVNVEIQTAEGKYARFGGAAHTDARGHYQIDDLPTASYVVFAAIPGKMVQTSRGLIGSSGAVIFAESTVRASKARLIQLQGTQTQNGVDIDIPVAGLHIVSGKVVSTSGQAINEGLVRLYPTGEPGLSLATPIGLDGAFSFDGVAEEQYTISVEFPDKVEFLGLTEDKTGMRMKRTKAPYAPISQAVTVAGQDPLPLVLQAEPE
jgi:Polysaccharide lyase family 4, domain II